jgi:hypothetical protein
MQKSNQRIISMFLLALCGILVILVIQEPRAIVYPLSKAPTTPEAATELPLWYSPLDSPLPTPISIEPFDTIQTAISVTNELFPSISGFPEVIYSNSITSDQFPSFGLDEHNFGASPPPMSFALVYGNFDTTDFGVGNKVSFNQARYIGYVFDLNTRSVMIVSISGNGEKFHQILDQLTPMPAAETTIVTTSETPVP